MVPHQPIIAVDFDGTIVDFAYPNIGALKLGAREALTRFRELGYFVLIWSCRTSPHLAAFYGDEGIPGRERHHYKEMKTFLDEHKIPYDDIDDGTLGKPVADFYIDDKGIRFADNWPVIQTFVELQATGLLPPELR